MDAQAETTEKRGAPSTRSETIAEITKALCAAVPKFTEIQKAKTAHTPKYSYAYADLSDILASVNPVLSANGLILRWVSEPGERGTLLTGILTHTSGEWFSSSLMLPNYSDDQARGSGLSYNKRYLVGMLLPIAATEPDDDGHRAAQDSEAKVDTDAILEQKRRERLEKGYKDGRLTPVKTIEQKPETAPQAPSATPVPAPEPEPASTPIDEVPAHLVSLQHKLEKDGVTVKQFMAYLTSPRPAQNKGAVRPAGFEFNKIDVNLANTLTQAASWRWVLKYAKEGVL